MITQIGIVAGDLWRYLERHGKVVLTDLIKDIDHSEYLILMALGWLTREGHMVWESQESIYSCSLKE